MQAVVDIAGHPLIQLLVGLVSVVLTIYSIRRSRIGKQLSYRVSDFPWERTWKPGTVTLRVAIWNTGSLPITASDVASPLVIRPSCESPLTGAAVSLSPGSERGLQLKSNPGKLPTLEVAFRYLDPGDGAVLELSYAGTSDLKLLMTGAIIGGGRPLIAVRHTLGDTLFFLSLLLFSWVPFFIGIAAFPASRLAGTVLMSIGAVFYPAAMGPAMTYRRRLRMPRPLFEAFQKPFDMVV